MEIGNTASGRTIVTRPSVATLRREDDANASDLALIGSLDRFSALQAQGEARDRTYRLALAAGGLSFTAGSALSFATGNAEMAVVGLAGAVVSFAIAAAWRS